MGATLFFMRGVRIHAYFKREGCGCTKCACVSYKKIEIRTALEKGIQRPLQENHVHAHENPPHHQPAI